MTCVHAALLQGFLDIVTKDGSPKEQMRYVCLMTRTRYRTECKTWRFTVSCVFRHSHRRKVLVLSVVVGGLNACVAGLIPLRLPHLFTNSLAVTANMRSLVPLLSWSLLAHALVMGLEGVLLARRRLGFLAR